MYLEKYWNNALEKIVGADVKKSKISENDGNWSKADDLT